MHPSRLYWVRDLHRGRVCGRGRSQANNNFCRRRERGANIPIHEEIPRLSRGGRLPQNIADSSSRQSRLWHSNGPAQQSLPCPERGRRPLSQLETEAFRNERALRCCRKKSWLEPSESFLCASIPSRKFSKTRGAQQFCWDQKHTSPAPSKDPQSQEQADRPVRRR